MVMTNLKKSQSNLNDFIKCQSALFNKMSEINQERNDFNAKSKQNLLQLVKSHLDEESDKESQFQDMV